MPCRPNPGPSPTTKSERPRRAGSARGRELGVLGTARSRPARLQGRHWGAKATANSAPEVQGVGPRPVNE
eukprot:9777620-Alexandrium_andersonii.AAC.1